MAVNLTDFDRIAHGEYNLGSVRLNREGNELEKVNNHKHLTCLNNKADDPEQNRRVRNALMEAFQNAGLAQDRLQFIRKQLGLAPGQEGVADKPLMRRDLKVLLDSQVSAREQLDKLNDYFREDRFTSLSRAFCDFADEYDKQIDRDRMPADPDASRELLEQSLRVAAKSVRAKLISGELQEFHPEDVTAAAVRYLKTVLDHGRKFAWLQAVLLDEPVDAARVKKIIRTAVEDGERKLAGRNFTTADHNEDYRQLGATLASALDDGEKAKLRDLFRSDKAFIQENGFGEQGTTLNPRRALFTGFLDGIGIPRTKMNGVFDRFSREFADRVEAKAVQLQAMNRPDLLASLRTRFGSTREEIERNVHEALVADTNFLGVLELDYTNPAKTIQTLQAHVRKQVKQLHPAGTGSSLQTNSRLTDGGAPEMFYRELLIDHLVENGLVFNGVRFTAHTERENKQVVHGGTIPLAFANCVEDEKMKALYEKIWTNVPKNLIPAVTFLCTSNGLMAGATDFMMDSGIHINDTPKQFFLEAMGSVIVGTHGASIDGLEIDTTPEDKVRIKVRVDFGVRPTGVFNNLEAAENQGSDAITNDLLSKGTVTFEAEVPKNWSMDAPDAHPITLVGMTGTQPSGEPIDYHV